MSKMNKETVEMLNWIRKHLENGGIGAKISLEILPYNARLQVVEALSEDFDARFYDGKVLVCLEK